MNTKPKINFGTSPQTTVIQIKLRYTARQESAISLLEETMGCLLLFPGYHDILTRRGCQIRFFTVMTGILQSSLENYRTTLMWRAFHLILAGGAA